MSTDNVTINAPGTASAPEERMEVSTTTVVQEVA
jgi:hypothetical protein